MHQMQAYLDLMSVGERNHDRNHDSDSFALKESELDLESHFEESW